MAKDIQSWNPEDEQEWAASGKSIATRNLWISIPSLLCGFAVWLYWGIITVQMLNLGFPYAKSELFSLAAIAGLSGATLRIPSTFFIRIAGGRNTIFFTTALLMIPALAPVWRCRTRIHHCGNSSCWRCCRVSAAATSHHPCPISAFSIPRNSRAWHLGLNAGLGNFGVTTMQILVPLSMTFAMFGGDSMTLQNASGTLIGKIPAGTETYLQNAGFVWLLFLVPLAFAGWFGMNNIRDEHVSPNIGNPLTSFGIITFMLLIAFFTAGSGLWLMLPEAANGSGFNVPKEIVLLLVVIATVGLLKLIPGEVGGTCNVSTRFSKTNTPG